MRAWHPVHFHKGCSSSRNASAEPSTRVTKKRAGVEVCRPEASSACHESMCGLPCQDAIRDLAMAIGTWFSITPAPCGAMIRLTARFGPVSRLTLRFGHEANDRRWRLGLAPGVSSVGGGDVANLVFVASAPERSPPGERQTSAKHSVPGRFADELFLNHIFPCLPGSSFASNWQCSHHARMLWRKTSND